MSASGHLRTSCHALYEHALRSGYRPTDTAVAELTDHKAVAAGGAGPAGNACAPGFGAADLVEVVVPVEGTARPRARPLRESRVFSSLALHARQASSRP